MKNKILIALLATLCIGATSAGLIACGDNSDPGTGPGTTIDPGKDPGNDTEKDPGPKITNGFIIKAVDNNNSPVANAYFNIGFYDSSAANDVFLTNSGTSTIDRARAAILKTGADGYATLEVEVDSGIDYKLYIADSTYLSQSGTTTAIPRGYSADLHSVDFTQSDDGIYTITANFILDNSWGALFDPTNNLVYSRYYPDFYKDELKVEYNPYVKNAQAGQLNYFSFSPYRAPMPDEEVSQSVMVQILAKARLAASGRYKVSWTASDPSAEVNLNLYSFVGGNYFQSNEDGSPTETYVLMHTGDTPSFDEAQLQKYYGLYKSFYGSEAQTYEDWRASYLNSFTGTNYITLELSTDDSATVYSFGYTASKNCSVTITIERIGDASTWTSEEVIMEIPSGETKAENREGRVIDVPLSANTQVVKGDDGYYRLGSKDGEIIYVQLNKSTRVNNLSMAYLADTANTDGRPQFVITEDVFNEANNSGIHYYYNYGNVVKGYAALANSDGLYPVNDLLKTVLEHFCKSMLGYNQYGANYWLAACQYYGEIADGTENKPFDLVLGDNSITLSNGSAWVAFTPTVSAYYEFNYNVPGSISAKNKYYVSLEAQTEFKFKVTGSGESVVLAVNSIPDNRHLRYYSTDASDSQIWHGTEKDPLNLNNLLVYMVTIDHSAYNAPITVSIKFPLSSLNGNYIIHVAGSKNYSVKVKAENGFIAYNGEAISLSNTVSTLIQLDSTADETFFIWVEKVS